MNLASYILARGLNRPTIEIAVDLVNAENGTDFPADKVKLGTPIAMAHLARYGDFPNSFIPLWVDPTYDCTFTQGGAAEGLLYNRIPLSLLTINSLVTFEQPTTFPYTVHSLLAAISDKVQTKFSAEDLINDTITELGTGLLIRAASKSKAWLGEFLISFTAPATNPRLMEDGTPRLMENGISRQLEDPLPV